MNNVENENPSLYDTISLIYNTKRPVSRLLYVAKLKELSGKDEKTIRDLIIEGFKKELVNFLKQIEESTNIMIMYLGTQHVLVSLENSSDNLMQYMHILYKSMNNREESLYHVLVNILLFVEDCPSAAFPLFYKYEVNLSQQESQFYKGKPILEKAWVVYDNFFCNLGKNLRSIINSEIDFLKNENRIKKEEASFLKYIPSQEEVNEFMGENFISLDKFYNLYIDTMDIELDEEVIWPYHWPLNV